MNSEMLVEFEFRFDSAESGFGTGLSGSDSGSDLAAHVPESDIFESDSFGIELGSGSEFGTDSVESIADFRIDSGPDY